MIDVMREPIFDLKAVASKLDVTYATALNWVNRGVNGRKLETVRVGKSIRTSPAAVNRFVMNTDGIGPDDRIEAEQRALEQYV